MAGFYRRKTSIFADNYTSRKTKVTLTWNLLVNIYDLKFHSTQNWNDIQAIIIFLKSIPTDERDYDPTTKIWGITEKHFQTVKTLIEHVQNFDVTVIEKPENSGNNNQGFTAAIIPLDKCIQDFERITGTSLMDSDGSGNYIKFGEAKRIYFKACLRLHPDKNQGNQQATDDMYKLNQAWNELQIRHFQVKEAPQLV